MRRIIDSTHITLDGVVEYPQDWPDGGNTCNTASGRVREVDALAQPALFLGVG
jgi:hypothetical protein